MQGRFIQTKIMTGRFTLPVSIAITVICWIGGYFFFTDIPEEEATYSFWEIISSFSIPVGVNKLICLIIHFAVGYMLILMNNAFGLIRVRASVQTSFYLLFIAACPAIQYLNAGNLATPAFVIAIYLLFDSYQAIKPSQQLFHAFLFVGLGSLVFPQITLLSPILLIGAFNFHALSLRSFFAAVIGWCLPYWFLFGHAFFYDDMDLFYQPFRDLASFSPIDFDQLPTWEIATLGFVFLLFLVSSIHCLAQGYLDKIRTRVHLRFLILLCLCIFIFIALQPIHSTTLLPLLLAGISILTCHMFVLTKSKITNVFFILSCTALFFLFCFNIWMLL